MVSPNKVRPCHWTDQPSAPLLSGRQQIWTGRSQRLIQQHEARLSGSDSPSPPTPIPPCLPPRHWTPDVTGYACNAIWPGCVTVLVDGDGTTRAVIGRLSSVECRLDQCLLLRPLRSLSHYSFPGDVMFFAIAFLANFHNSPLSRPLNLLQPFD